MPDGASRDIARTGSSGNAAGARRGEVEKLVEYRRAHYAAQSEAASYFTNTPARVQFRFANPIICQLKTGHKVMSVGGGAAFDFRPGDAMFVPPDALIDIDLGTADPDDPIECDCIEIERGRIEDLLARLNDRLSRGGQVASAGVDWSRHAVLRGAEAEDLGLPLLMDLFRGERDMLSDLRIDARIDDTVLRLLQLRSRELLVVDEGSEDNGVFAAARLIRERLDGHVTNAELARAACLSESTLHRRFLKHFGTTPARFATQLRVAEAKTRLRGGDEPVEALAFALGFTDASHFARVFRKSTGETPAEYRKRRETPVALPRH